MVRCSENGVALVTLLYVSIALGSVGSLCVGAHFANLVYKNVRPRDRRRGSVIVTISIIVVGSCERTFRLIETWLRLESVGYITRDVLYHLNNLLFGIAVSLMFHSQIETLRTCFGDSTYKVSPKKIAYIRYCTALCIISALIWGVFNDLSVVVETLVGRVFIAVTVTIVLVSGFAASLRINFEFAWRFRTMVAQFTVDVGKELELEPMFGVPQSMASQNRASRSRRNTDPGCTSGTGLTPAPIPENGSPKSQEIPPKSGFSSGGLSTRMSGWSLSMKSRPVTLQPSMAGPSLSLPPQPIASTVAPPVYQTSLSVSEQTAAEGSRAAGKRMSGIMKLSNLKHHSVSRFDETQRRFLELVAKKTVICVSSTVCLFFICCGMVLFAFGNFLVSIAVSTLALCFCLTIKESQKSYEWWCFYANRWTRKIVAYQTVQRVSEVYTERSTNGFGSFKITVQTNDGGGSSPSS